MILSLAASRVYNALNRVARLTPFLFSFMKNVVLLPQKPIMKINKDQLEAIRCLLTAENKQELSILTRKSPRTIQAILQGDRTNPDVLNKIYSFALNNFETLIKTFNAIDRQNVQQATLPIFKEKKNADSWTKTNNFYAFSEAYLQLCHLNFDTIDDLWAMIEKQFNYLIPATYYCIELLKRTMAIDDARAINYYNKKCFFKSLLYS